METIMDAKIMFPDKPEDAVNHDRNGHQHGENGTKSETMSANTAIARFKAEADKRDTIPVGDPSEINIDFIEDTDMAQNILGMKGTVVIRPEAFGNADPVPVSDMGLRTLCSMIGKSPTWFKNHVRPDNRFAMLRRTANESLTFDRGDQEGFNLRFGSDALGSMNVDAFLPKNWNPMNDHDIVTGIIESMQSFHGDDSVAGIEAIGGDRHGNVGVRVVMDEPIIADGFDSTYSTLPMITYRSNEYGLAPAQVDMGVWQVVCWNGIVEAVESMRAVWDHTGEDGARKFQDRIREVMMRVQHYIPIMRETIERQANTPLPGGMSAEELISRLFDMDAIIRPHHDAMNTLAEWQTIENVWEFLSLMTDAAKLVNPLTRRQKAEQDAAWLAQVDGDLDSLIQLNRVRPADKNIAVKAFENIPLIVEA